MLPPNFEYLFVLIVLCASGISLFGPRFAMLYRRIHFCASLFFFIFLCFCIDLVAVKAGWWSFSPERCVGIEVLGIPIEEFLLFSFVFSATVLAWEEFSNGME